MRQLGAVVERVIAGERAFDITELASSIGWCRHALRDRAHGGGEKNAEVISQLTDMLTRLRSADFVTRMRLWVGGWWLDLDNQKSPGDEGDHAIAALAAEACATPPLLDGAVMAWLGTGAQQGGKFWYEVGRRDDAGSFKEVIRDFGRQKDRASTMVVYVSGWRERDQNAARAFFDQTVRDGAHPRGILLGALQIDLPDIGAQRIAGLLRDSRLDATEIDSLNAARWARDVSESSLVPVLELMAGADMEGAPQIPELVEFGFHDKPFVAGPLTHFIWRYLEARLS